MSSVSNLIAHNLETLSASLLRDLAEALEQPKTGTKKVLAKRIVGALSKQKEVKSPRKGRKNEDRDCPGLHWDQNQLSWVCPYEEGH